MNMKKHLSCIVIFYALISSHAHNLVTTPRKSRMLVTTPATTFNQQITSSSLNNTDSAMLGQFKIMESGYYFLSTDLQTTPGQTDLAVIYINASNVVLDLGNRSIAVGLQSTLSNTAGIEVAPGVTNVTIMNGTINGVSNNTTSFLVGIRANENTNVTLENLQILNCSVAGINFNDVKSPYLKNVHVYNTANVGALLQSCADGVIIDSSFNGCSVGTNQSAFGLGAENCTNFALDNVSASNNSSSLGSAFGVYLDKCTGFECNRMNTSNNVIVGSGTFCAGVHLLSSTGCSFTHCSANNNTAPYASALGFSVANHANGNTFTECEASSNTGANSAAGFQISASKNTRLQECQSNNNQSTNIACGVLSTLNSKNNVIRKCKTNGNNSLSGNAYGIALTNEYGSIIEHCEASLNDGGRGSGCGIALIGTCVKTAISFNTMFSNTGSTKQYGFKDFAPNSTTLLRANLAFGQGRSFTNGNSAALVDSSAMNYMLTYSQGSDQMNTQFLIRESDIADLNAFEISSNNWFNYSIITGND